MATPALLFLIMLLVQTGLWFHAQHVAQAAAQEAVRAVRVENGTEDAGRARAHDFLDDLGREIIQNRKVEVGRTPDVATVTRSEEHTSELQSLMRISYAVFCLKQKIKQQHTKQTT